MIYLNTDRVFEKIDCMSEKYVDFLCDICSFEAKAYDKQEIDRMNDRITSFAESEGFSVKRTYFDNCGDFLTVECNEGAEKGCLFLAHTDTVHNKGVFGYPAVKKDEERITRIGSSPPVSSTARAVLPYLCLLQKLYVTVGTKSI